MERKIGRTIIKLFLVSELEKTENKKTIRMIKKRIMQLIK